MKHRMLMAAAGIIARNLFDLFRTRPEKADHAALVKQAVRRYMALEGADIEVAEMAVRAIVEPRLTYDLVWKGPQALPTRRIARAFRDKPRSSIRRCYYISNEMRQATRASRS